MVATAIAAIEASFGVSRPCATCRPAHRLPRPETSSRPMTNFRMKKAHSKTRLNCLGRELNFLSEEKAEAVRSALVLKKALDQDKYPFPEISTPTSTLGCFYTRRSRCVGSPERQEQLRPETRERRGVVLVLSLSIGYVAGLMMLAEILVVKGSRKSIDLREDRALSAPPFLKSAGST